MIRPWKDVMWAFLGLLGTTTAVFTVMLALIINTVRIECPPAWEIIGIPLYPYICVLVGF